MKYKYPCSCECLTIVETDQTPPKAVSCFKCKKSISKKGDKEVVLDPPSFTEEVTEETAVGG